MNVTMQKEHPGNKEGEVRATPLGLSAYNATMLSREQLSALLAEFQRLDAAGNGWVPAGEVDAALRAVGIATTVAQDEALLLLHVDAASGKVFYDRLRSEANLAVAPAASSTISQQDLVFKLTRELREAFNKYDIGQYNLSKLRERLAALGFKETRACLELFRHPYDMTYNQLVQALLRADQVPSPSERSNIPPPSFVSPSTSETRGLRKSEDRHLTTNPFSTIEVKPKDSGLLRQQVHAVVRLLDSGEIDENTFRRRLTDIGVAVPGTVQRLLDLHKSGTRVTFREWIKAFENYFAANPVPVDENQSTKTDALNIQQSSASKGLVQTKLRQSKIFSEEYASEPVESAESRQSRKHWPAKVQRIPFAYETAPIGGEGLQIVRDAFRAPIRPPENRNAFRHMFSGEDAPPQERPIRTTTQRASTGRIPFALEGEVQPPKSISGIPRSPERRTGRIPFGTEADYAASFANGVPPQLG